jgi:hydrogenase maturation protease
MGNDLLGDDGVALLVAREMQKAFLGGIDIVETSEAGLALMEVLTGYDKALIVDSVQTLKHPPGTVIEFVMSDFRKVIGPSPHYAGMPEVFSMAERLGIPMPTDLRILAMEVANPFDFSESLTPDVAAGLPELVRQARGVLEGWVAEG